MGAGEIEAMVSKLAAKVAANPDDVEGARMLGQLDRIGTLAAGKQADLVVIRASDLNMQPVHDPVSSVVFQTSLANIDSVMVAGQWKKRHGQLLGVDLAQVRAQARALLAAGCEAVCVFFLHAYANPVNEQAAVAAVRELWPNPHVTAAAEVLPEIREFERTSTTVVNAYIGPVVSRYLLDLAADLRRIAGLDRLQVMQSSSR